ncbi:tripartite tricarboxylate transporter TctB family protein [Limnohabitans sp.]|uniref:tripartite tricarboxylate transporter TctB family protein n=1 Tax=Limnohabitans sp. TaxID=1907725 RepID=UPI0039BD41C9
MSMEVEDEEVTSPREDLIAAVLCVAFGLAVSIGAWRMDRLEKLSINPYEVPGLVPFFLGCAITVLGLVLLIRAWAQGGWQAPTALAKVQDPTLLRHMALVFGWSMFYALVLVGKGVPFMLGTFLFITVFIGVLDRQRQIELGRSANAQWVRAAIYGGCWSLLVALSFEYIFLVRLP